MAAINQTNLNSMASAINNCASNYELTMTTEAKNMLDAFNNNWISPSAQELATEIQTCLESVENAIVNIFSTKSEEITNVVKNFNMVENESIAFSGFSFGKPTIDMTLNATLPNGKVGMNDEADLSTINNPMEKLTTSVVGILNEIANKVQTADALDNDEQAALTQRLNSIKSDFEMKMNELKDSLSSRIQQEIDIRNHMKKVNLDNLSA